eukprot:ctg_536.g272
MFATLASGDVDVCLIPEIEFDLAGDCGLLSHIERLLDTKGHCVIVVAEGAGLSQMLRDDDDADEAHDASGNVKLPNVGIWLSDEIKRHFRARGREINLKYLDPSYEIRSVPPVATDTIMCTLLAQSAVHGAMAGYTGFICGVVAPAWTSARACGIECSRPRCSRRCGIRALGKSTISEVVYCCCGYARVRWDVACRAALVYLLQKCLAVVPSAPFAHRCQQQLHSINLATLGERGPPSAPPCDHDFSSGDAHSTSRAAAQHPHHRHSGHGQVGRGASARQSAQHPARVGGSGSGHRHRAAGAVAAGAVCRRVRPGARLSRVG